MTSIQLTLTGAQAKAEVNGLLTAGMVGVPVTIVWDESWNGLVKTLVCRSDGCIRTILNVGSQALVAPEVFRTEKWAPNALYLGVEGRDTEGKLVIPSTFAYCGQILPGAVTEGTVSQEPENPAWAQILGCIGDMEALETTRKASLVEAINEAAGLGPSQGTATSVSAGYQLSSSHNQIPTGTWSTSVPAPAAGKYLWTKITLNRGGEASTSVYSVSGGVTSVNWIQPDSTGNIALTAAQTGAVPLSGGTMTGPLNLVSPTASAHGATKSYVDTSSRKASPYNLLDNSDFRNPVNQRGKSSYKGTAFKQYTIDRWCSWASDGQTILTINSKNITIGTGAHILQSIDVSKRDLTKKYTLALKSSDGTIQIASGNLDTNFGNRSCGVYEYSNGIANVYVYNGTWEWVALYEGEYTAETLPEYRPKGYAAELLECQRYFYRVPGDAQTSYTGYIPNATTLRVTIPLPVPMRITPTLAVTSVEYITAYGNTSTTVDSITTGKLDRNACSLVCTGSFSETNISVAMRFNTEVSLSADL